jgi:hypothetical protein
MTYYYLHKVYCSRDNRILVCYSKHVYRGRRITRRITRHSNMKMTIYMTTLCKCWKQSPWPILVKFAGPGYARSIRGYLYPGKLRRLVKMHHNYIERVCMFQTLGLSLGFAPRMIWAMLVTGRKLTIGVLSKCANTSRHDHWSSIFPTRSCHEVKIKHYQQRSGRPYIYTIAMLDELYASLSYLRHHGHRRHFCHHMHSPWTRCDGRGLLGEK